MKALFFRKTDERTEAGYFDCPWKTLEPDKIVTSVIIYAESAYKETLVNQFSEEVEESDKYHCVVVNSKNEIIALRGTEDVFCRFYSDGINIQSIWNQWP